MGKIIQAQPITPRKLANSYKDEWEDISKSLELLLQKEKIDLEPTTIPRIVGVIQAAHRFPEAEINIPELTTPYPPKNIPIHLRNKQAYLSAFLMLTSATQLKADINYRIFVRNGAEKIRDLAYWTTEMQYINEIRDQFTRESFTKLREIYGRILEKSQESKEDNFS